MDGLSALCLAQTVLDGSAEQGFGNDWDRSGSNGRTNVYKLQ